MSDTSELNRFMTEVYNDILYIEQKELSRKNGLTITELHIIEKIGIDEPKTMSEVAEELGITLATLTTAADRLEKKKCIVRQRSEQDKRVVNISLTGIGKMAYRCHENFHESLIDSVTSGLSELEQEALIKALKNLNDYFIGKINKYKQKTN